MKQIVVISGKGGTGKTVITASFAALAKNSASSPSAKGEISPPGSLKRKRGEQSGGKVMADCDVDAADLHLLLKPDIKERHEFRSGKTARIDKELCRQCGKCIDVCRFNAISENFEIDPIDCEGCGFCSFVCPEKAVIMEENVSGEWFISETRFGPMVHAKLGIAEENSGKLVSLVRKQAKDLAGKLNCDWVIVDGAPGIGCPVIASLSGIDCALVVTEPTLSGLHDADRVIGVARHFGISVALVVNKYDLNIEMTEKIKTYCKNNNVELIGKIPFDESVVKAMVGGKTIMEFEESKVKEDITDIWERLQKIIK